VVLRRLRNSLLCLAAVVAVVAAAGTGTAAAASPCWKVLINDWYDGRIDRVYAVTCYRDALDHMPEDVAQYSSLRDDINRALAAVISGKDPTAGGREPGGTFHGGPKSTAASSGGRDPGAGGPVASAFDSIGPKDADSVPIPLLVLGGLAIALLALGSAGFIARRVQARKAGVRPKD
jgi:hypothetical protein